MGSAEPSDVLAASTRIDDTWLLARESVDVVRTGDFVAYCRAAHLTSATYGRVQVKITSARPLEHLAPDIDDVVRHWNADAAQWRFVREPDRDDAQWLHSAGATLVLTEAVMARSLDDPDAQAWLARKHDGDVSTTVVRDRASFDSLVGIETAGWGSSPRPRELVAEAWTELQSGLATSTEWTLLGSVGATPVAVARLVLIPPAIRLFGSVTLPGYRRRGLYGALLTERCRIGSEHGATMALTKARIDTSAPVLRRHGFASYGLEHRWLVPSPVHRPPAGGTP